MMSLITIHAIKLLYIVFSPFSDQFIVQIYDLLSVWNAQQGKEI